MTAPPPAGCSKQPAWQQQKQLADGGTLGAMANKCQGKFINSYYTRKSAIAVKVDWNSPAAC